MITISCTCTVTHIIIVSSSFHLLIAICFCIDILRIARHGDVAVGAIRQRPLVLILMEIDLCWRLISWLVICSWEAPRVWTRHVRRIGFIERLMTGSKVVTILIRVTLTPFVYCHNDGTVVVVGKSFSFFLLLGFDDGELRLVLLNDEFVLDLRELFRPWPCFLVLFLFFFLRSASICCSW